MKEGFYLPYVTGGWTMELPPVEKVCLLEVFIDVALAVLKVESLQKYLKCPK